MTRLHADSLGQTVNGLAGGGTPIAYTPVVTWTGNTITTQSGFYLKTPGKLEVWASFVQSAGAATATLTITIPTGYTAVSMAGALPAFTGWVAASGVAYGLIAAPGATTQITTQTTVLGVVNTWEAFMSIPTLT